MNNNTRLIQIEKGKTRRVALVDEPQLRLLQGCSSIYSLTQEAMAAAERMTSFVLSKVTSELLQYDPIYDGLSEWRLLPPIDHPEPARCLISGTGLTHLGSARDRQAMHVADEQESDSMKMFRWGVEGGRPAPGCIGIPPEWFYKGNGTVLRAHGEGLEVPPYAEDGGEEAEIAGIYLVGPDGSPRRLGMAIGNEFSDHRFEKRSYLNLASSKIRTCALGPELVVDPDFQSVPGKVIIERAGAVLWSRDIRTGEAEMCHSLENIEHHHFKFESHRRPEDIHVHFFGADCLSFGHEIQLAAGDVMQIGFENFGRPLRNYLRNPGLAQSLVGVLPLG